MTVRTLFIGMDGATFTVLNELIKPGLDGEPEPIMPFLGKIFAEGSRAKLRSTPNPLTPPSGTGSGHTSTPSSPAGCR